MRSQKQKISEYNVIFQEEKEGGFSVWVPELPGCASQGETFDEALVNIKEAIQLYLGETKRSHPCYPTRNSSLYLSKSMPKLPIVSGKELIKVLGKVGFVSIRQRGDHVIMKHADGRVVTIPLKKRLKRHS